MSEHCVAFCTCPSEDVARDLSSALVGENLVACVNILPGLTSVFQWQGRVETEQEVLMVIKTARDRSEALASRIAELHPYDVPEVVVLPIESGLPAYLDWIVQETRSQ